MITDYLGRPRQVRDGESNALVWQLSPTLFGGEVDKELEKKTGYELNVRFPGQFEDMETGLYYNHWRYYDKSTGRYITPDPLGLAGGDNVYAYVNAAPTHFVDAPGLLLFAFDGTGNKDYGDDNHPSNVVKFRDAYRKNPNEPSIPAKLNNQVKSFGAFSQQNAFYISGAGTEDQYTNIGSNGHLGDKDAGIGTSLSYRVDQMLIYFSDYLDKVLAVDRKNKTDKERTKISLDVIGFSRGAASARMFASRLEWLLNQDYSKSTIWLNPVYQSNNTQGIKWKYSGAFLCQNGIDINFNYLGLWDTVSSLGPISIRNDEIELNDMNKGFSLKISNNWKSVVQAVAVNENRSGFAVRSIYTSSDDAKLHNNKSINGKFRLERGFLGAHSDIGGGYAEGDLSDVSLMWIIKEAEDTAGLKFIVPNAYRTVTNPTVHDSVGVKWFSEYDPAREFLWSTQSSKGVSQFADQSHLILDWSHSRAFENLQYASTHKTKFNRIWELSGKNYDKDAYLLLKKPDSSSDREQTILYDGTDPNERMQIKKYLKFINDAYNLSLSTNYAN